MFIIQFKPLNLGNKLSNQFYIATNYGIKRTCDEEKFNTWFKETYDLLKSGSHPSSNSFRLEFIME